MTNTNYMRALTTVLAAALAAGLLVTVVGSMKPAKAQNVPPGKIAFKSERDGVRDETSNVCANRGNYDICGEIYVMDDDGGNETRLTTDPPGDPAEDFSPAISPDGTRIAFMSNREDGNEDIYVMDARDLNGDGQGDNLLRLTDDPATDVRPSFSPDGSRIVFESFRDGNYDIYTMSATIPESVTPPQQLTDNPATDYAPDFSPDGTTLSFSSDRDGDYDIYSMDAVPEDPTTNPPQPLTNNSAADLVPDFSPDGTTIAFSSNRTGKYKIYTMDADGSGETRISRGKGSDYGPDYAPDGTRIAFYRQSKNTAGTDIFTMNADGTSATRLTSAKKDDTLPSWGLATAP